MPRKCPISRKQFHEAAKPITVKFCNADGQACGMPYVMLPKEFNTGSIGYHYQQKIDLVIGGVSVPCTMGFLITANNSKDLPYHFEIAKDQANG